MKTKAKIDGGAFARDRCISCNEYQKMKNVGSDHSRNDKFASSLKMHATST